VDTTVYLYLFKPEGFSPEEVAGMEYTQVETSPLFVKLKAILANWEVLLSYKQRVEDVARWTVGRRAIPFLLSPRWRDCELASKQLSLVAKKVSEFRVQSRGDDNSYRIMAVEFVKEATAFERMYDEARDALTWCWDL
jgi:hypothetical protein